MSLTITLLYATASGNAEMLAQAAAERLATEGYPVQVSNVADFPAARLREVDVALIIASTWGEGEPPPDAAEFCAAVQEPAQLRLEHLRYAVLALGSRGYTDFCGCGRRLDEQLAACGARRLLARVDCDTKFKHAFEQWLTEVLAVLSPRSS